MEKDSIVLYMLDQLPAAHPFAIKIAALFLIFYQIAYINRLVGIHKLTIGNSLFPGIFYVLLLSFIPEIHTVSTILIGNTFLIIAIYNLFQVIHRKQRSKRIFNAGFHICLATFFNIEFLWFFPFFILAGNNLVAIKRKDITLYSLGFFLPIYMLLSYLLLTQQTVPFIQDFILKLEFFTYPFFYANYGIVKVGIIGLLTLFICITFNSIVNRTNIFVRNKLNFIFYLLIFSWIVLGLSPSVGLSDTIILLAPLAILISAYLLQVGRTNISESFHFLLLLLAIMFQYFLY